MHEMSLLRDLLAKVQSIAAENGGGVTSVKVRLGALAHISADHLREHFVEAIRGSTLEGADLEVVTCEDTEDPHAQDIILDSVQIAEAGHADTIRN